MNKFLKKCFFRQLLRRRLFSTSYITCVFLTTSSPYVYTVERTYTGTTWPFAMRAWIKFIEIINIKPALQYEQNFDTRDARGIIILLTMLGQGEN